MKLNDVTGDLVIHREVYTSDPSIIWAVCWGTEATLQRHLAVSWGRQVGVSRHTLRCYLLVFAFYVLFIKQVLAFFDKNY